MRRLVAWPLFCLALAGCAAIAGVDQFKEDQCPGGCDGSVLPDVGGDAPVTTEGGVDATKDQQASDVTAKDSPNDVVTGSDASDGGCGATNTVQNCGACGVACSSSNVSNAACTGTSCLYTCNQGFSDCDTTAPNTNGCECNTPGCCQNSCQTTHANGLGQNFYDCVALGTHTQPQASEACGAYTGNQGACTAYSCTGPGSNLVVCGTTNGICACWDYSGTNVGYAVMSSSSSCICPGTSDKAWN